MTPPSKAAPKRGRWHRIKHLLGLQGYEFVGITHEDSCPGFCFISGIKQCDWKVTICCRECGQVKVI